MSRFTRTAAAQIRGERTLAFTTARRAITAIDRSAITLMPALTDAGAQSVDL
jgi:hypothetical protein